MSRFKKALALFLVVVLTAMVSVNLTMAYLQHEDSDVNVMTLGNVKIQQIEEEWNEEGTALQTFTQKKPLYPYVGTFGWKYPASVTRAGELTELQKAYRMFTMENVQDKYVSVKNVGKSDAYVRTLIALEMGQFDETAFDMVGVSINALNGSEFKFPGAWEWQKGIVVEVNKQNYYVMEAVHQDVVKPDETTIPSLLQVYLSNTATNETVEKLDGNENGLYDILVISQAVQTEGFASAKIALDTAFGAPAENAALWFGKLSIPQSAEDAVFNSKVTYNGTVYNTLYDAVAAANANGGGEITMEGSARLDRPLELASNITISGNGHKLVRENGYTGTMLTVKSGATLTTNNLTLDGDGATATGNLVATEGNGSIVFNAGTALKNNHGAHAVSLATRGGGTMTMNGNAQIVNNSSDSGAVWGGGHIIINDDAKISHNSSTGSAGAIRMVSGQNLTMNGGEISYNTAVASGGAIYGYGASIYNLNGGKMVGNTAATGGAMYTGDGSTVNISGTFEMCNNTANDAGAMRLSNRTAFNMSGGKISGNVSKNNSDWNGFYGWNPGVNISGGQLEDDITIQGGLTPIVGGNGITGVIHFALSTNHNTAYLAQDFGTIKFTVAEDSNFAAFNFKPAAGYTYTTGDETKLICQNNGYTTYWDATSGTFRLQAG